MSKVTRFVGLDVHARTIAIAVAEGRGQVRPLGEVENRPDAGERVLRKLGTPQDLKVCYEAGPGAEPWRPPLVHVTELPNRMTMDMEIRGEPQARRFTGFTEMSSPNWQTADHDSQGKEGACQDDSPSSRVFFATQQAN